MNRIKAQKDYAPFAKMRILELLEEKKVATEREIKVNLERDPIAEDRWNIHGFFPWVIGFAIQALLQEGKIEPHGYRGRVRLGSGTPAKFYSSKGIPYAEIEEVIAEKRRISKYINALLTERGVATIHAEEIIRGAFEQLNFKFIDRDVSKLGNKEVKPPPTGPPSNVDFVFEKDDITYGVDVKNWIAYEDKTISKIKKKLDVCRQLDIVPYIITRYVDDDTMYHIISQGGLVYRYWELLIPSSFDSLAKRVRELLGIPVIATDALPEQKKAEIQRWHAEKVKKQR